MIRRTILSIIAFFPMVSNAESKILNLSLELSSKYMWRGMEYGTSPTLFPMLSFNKAGFNIFGMGAYALDGSHQEVDLGVSYTYKGFTIGVSDYYYPSAVGENDKYFDFNNRTTKHYVEGYLTMMPFKYPLWFTVSTYIYGCDKDLNGEQAYSSYIETGYSHYFNDDNILSAAIGANLNKSIYTDYEGGFNVVNVMLKYTYNLNLNKFCLPLSASYIINPYREKGCFTFSAYLNF